jgi:hypothetical protein
MGRIRTIKPEFFQDEELSALSIETHMLAAGLLCYADDYGYFNANSGLIRAAIFPLRELSREIPEMMKSLADIEYIVLGVAADGKRYGQICKFQKHQKVSHPTPSKIEPLRINWEISGISPEDSLNLENFSRLNREQGTGNREQESAGASALFPVRGAQEDPPSDTPPKQLAAQVMDELQLLGWPLTNAIEGVCRQAMKSGTSAESLLSSLVGAWKDYEKSKPNLKYAVGAEKFFGHGIWRNRVGWPWKDGCTPSPARATRVPDAAERQMAEDAARMQQQQAIRSVQ